MPTHFLDLPLEILIRIPHDGMPDVYHVWFHDEQWRGSRAVLSALAQTCSYFYRIFNPHLYRTLFVTELPVNKRLCLMRTITARPDLAQYVEDVRLNISTHRFPLRDKSAGFGANSMLELHDDIDGDWWRLLACLFFPNMTKLKQLYIRCTRLDNFSCEFPELISAHISSSSEDKRTVGLGHAALEKLLMAPKISTLLLDGPLITDAKSFNTLTSRTSNVSTLELSLAEFSLECLTNLLRLPYNLITLGILSGSMQTPLVEVQSEKWITFKQLGVALEPQKHSLHHITITFPDWDNDCFPKSILGGLSFNSFTRLTSLVIATEMCLGWKECPHQDVSADQVQNLLGAINFADCLPYCVEDLTIYVPRLQRVRNGDGYLLDVVRGIVHERKRFDKLKYIGFDVCDIDAHCPDCEAIGLAYPDESPTIGKAEIKQIQQVCHEADIEFNLWGN